MTNIDVSKIDWTKIAWQNFEKFIYYALEKEGFRNTRWFGVAGGDDARDICATTYEELPLNLGYERTWIFQCKKWAKLPSKALIRDEAEGADAHDPDFWVLVIPLPIHAKYYDMLNDIQKKFNFDIKVIPLHEIEKLIEKHNDLLNVLLHGTIISSEVQNTIQTGNTVKEEIKEDIKETIVVKTSQLDKKFEEE